MNVEISEYRERRNDYGIAITKIFVIGKYYFLWEMGKYTISVYDDDILQNEISQIPITHQHHHTIKKAIKEWYARHET